MIGIHVREMNGAWFGLACADEALVATVVGKSRRGVLGILARCLPRGVQSRLIEERSEYVEKTMAMLKDLEAGNEDRKCFRLASEYVAEPLSKVLRSAAAIPIGYVTPYGNIAKAAGTDARAVGRIMASNPLYPIVPCHRVVGANLSMVGYRGSRDPAALEAKIGRLRRETRGYAEAREVSIDEGRLTVYPVEWAIKKADRAVSVRSYQPTLFGPGANR
jgi:O-6-methylguanine DNA methyltransferase